MRLLFRWKEDSENYNLCKSHDQKIGLVHILLRSQLIILPCLVLQLCAFLVDTS